MTDRRAYHREYKREQREAARKGGLCIICCKLEPKAGNVTCVACQKRNNGYKGKSVPPS